MPLGLTGTQRSAGNGLFCACVLFAASTMGCDPQRAATPHAPNAPDTAHADPTPEVPAASPPAPVVTDVEGLLRVDAPALMQRIASTTNRGTVVSVWATWCGSCRREIPMYLELRKTFLSNGLDFVFISADEPTAFANVVDQMRAWGGPLPALAVGGSMGRFMREIDPRWLGALPATFLFDNTPKLRHFWEGPVYEHEITPILQGFLAGEPIDGETRPPITGGPSAP